MKILLDFDGTIVDNKSAHQTAFVSAFDDFGVKLDFNALEEQAWFGLDSFTVVKNIIGSSDEALIAEIVDRKRVHFSAIQERLALNTNVRDLFNALPLGHFVIFSNGSSARINRFLAKNNLYVPVLAFGDFSISKDSHFVVENLIPNLFSGEEVFVIDDNYYFKKIFSENKGIKFIHYLQDIDLVNIFYPYISK